MRGIWPIIALLGAALSTGGGALAFPYDTPPGHVGLFGGNDCTACHFDGVAIRDAANLRIIGLPDSYTPGRRYLLTVRLEDPAMKRAGFQLAIVYLEGPEAGRQAGWPMGLDGRLSVTAGEDFALYVSVGEAAGRSWTGTDGFAEWSLVWEAPAGAQDMHDMVGFFVAANAADGDDSPFGDQIYLRRLEVPGSETPDRLVRGPETGANGNTAEAGPVNPPEADKSGPISPPQ